jgi:hypothetical protein
LINFNLFFTFIANLRSVWVEKFILFSEQYFQISIALDQSNHFFFKFLKLSKTLLDYWRIGSASVKNLNFGPSIFLQKNSPIINRNNARDTQIFFSLFLFYFVFVLERESNHKAFSLQNLHNPWFSSGTFSHFSASILSFAFTFSAFLFIYFVVIIVFGEMWVGLQVELGFVFDWFLNWRFWYAWQGCCCWRWSWWFCFCRFIWWVWMLFW